MRLFDDDAPVVSSMLREIETARKVILPTKNPTSAPHSTSCNSPSVSIFL